MSDLEKDVCGSPGTDAPPCGSRDEQTAPATAALTGYPHVEQEQALVWRGGGRRFFTREAALKNAAKAIVRNALRAGGDDNIPLEQFMAAAAQVRGQIERGETPEVDWDALPEAAAPSAEDPFDADFGGAA